MDKKNLYTLPVEQKTRNTVLESNPSAPTLKGLIKLHKPNISIRRLGAPTYILSKIMSRCSKNSKF